MPSALAKDVSTPAILMTPEKRKRQKLDHIDGNNVRPRLELRVDDCGAPSPGIETDSRMEAVDVEECALLCKLFGGLDQILQLFSRRGLRSAFPAVRADVEIFVGKDLSGPRLAHVLGLARGMIKVGWLGTGKCATLVLTQLAEDGKERPPTADELSNRLARVTAALEECRLHASAIPRAEFPPIPPCPPETVRPVIAHPDDAPDVMPATTSHKTGSAIQLPGIDADSHPDCDGLTGAHARRKALLARVRAREAMNNSAETCARRALRCRLQVCDNAIAALTVLQALFARGRGVASAATEAEVIKALCSDSFGMQSVNALDRAAAQDAVAKLVEKRDGWFHVETGVHVQDAKYFRRLQRGAASAAAAALQVERQELEMELCQVAPQASAAASFAAMAAHNVGTLGRTICGDDRATATINCTKTTSVAAVAQPVPVVACCAAPSKPRRRIRVKTTENISSQV